jgi:mono/diheme cytochrome c family protein
MQTFLKGGLIFVALLLFAGHLLHSSSARARQQKQEEAAASPSGQSSRAKTLFAERCARCHGADGRGQTVIGEMLDVPDFTDANWWKEGMSDKRFANSITHGKGEMPAFGKKLSKHEISTLAAYVRRFGKAAR